MLRSVGERLNVAVIGTGIAGLSAAWLLSQKHDVTLYEKEARPGGHSNTVHVAGRGGSRGQTIAVDTGFIVYNRATYPNLSALFEHLGVATQDSNMSFAVSLRNGALEYSGTGLRGVFAQKRNLLRPKFWSLLADLRRFYQSAPVDAEASQLTLGDYLHSNGYGRPFQDEHILPMAAAIWSASAEDMRAYPVAAFARFFKNHELFRLGDRAPWRTVTGGSCMYVQAMLQAIGDKAVFGTAVTGVERRGDAVTVRDAEGGARTFDHVVLATHADQALRVLDASPRERAILGAFRYASNRAVLHSDPSFMPRRRLAWSSWNYTGEAGDGGAPSVTYWMNRLQSLPAETPLFVTLNPAREPADADIHRVEHYEHPLFDAAALAAQAELWSLQGTRRTWFCGAYFGAGFHEDGLQAGLAVAEQLGGLRRPWRVPDESGRIVLGRTAPALPEETAA